MTAKILHVIAYLLIFYGVSHGEFSHIPGTSDSFVCKIQRLFYNKGVAKIGLVIEIVLLFVEPHLTFSLR